MKAQGLPFYFIFFCCVFSSINTFSTVDELTNSPPVMLSTQVIPVMQVGDIRAAIQKIWMHGLNPDHYWTKDLERRFKKYENKIIPADDALSARANEVFLLMLHDLSVGSVNPKLLGSDVKFKKKKLSIEEVQEIILAENNEPDRVFERLAPKNPPYKNLQETLLRIYPACQNGEWKELPQLKRNLVLHSQDPIVLEIKKRLSILGYGISKADDIFDEDLLDAVNDMQVSLRWKPDGQISKGGRSWRFLKKDCRFLLRQIQADMEKMRWFPKEFDNRFVFVNLAHSEFILKDYLENDEDSPFDMTFKVINGRPSRKTPTMQDKIVRVILNPFWVVPKKIFFDDKVTEIRKIPPGRRMNYFVGHNYEVWNKSFTRKINPESVDWRNFNDPSESVDIFIRQLPHKGNALGSIKFELTNTSSIYMHDTNQPELFENPKRFLSSGCIRLERPLEFAEYLLKGTEWDRKKIESAVAKDNEVIKNSTYITLDQPLTVYVAMICVQLGGDGIIRYSPDIYGQSSIILKKMVGLF